MDTLVKRQENKKQYSAEKLDVRLYHAKNIDQFQWPSDQESDLVRRFVTPLMKEGSHCYIENVKTEVCVIQIGKKIFPLTINEAQYENSYVCSPYGYLRYALDCPELISNPALRFVLNTLIKGLVKFVRFGQINKVIMVNNWLFSTNIYPTLTEIEVQLITAFLKDHFPHHAIIFPSIDQYIDQERYRYLHQNGYQLIANRQVFFLNGKNPEVFETRLFKSDLRLWKKSGYELIDATTLPSKEYERLLELYSNVYISKYSSLNPKLTVRFIQHAVENRLLHIYAIQKDQSIDGVIGYFYRHGVMFCPFLGYDTKKPKEPSLYRLLCTILMLEAQKHQTTFHQSSGASFYKTIRRAEPHLEYQAVYIRHLPFYRQIPWLVLKGVFNTIGIPFMKKY